MSGFAAACRQLGATAADHELDRAGQDLERRWASPDRGYHDRRHLTEVLDHLAELGAASPQTLLAAWFHDAVYEGRPGQDEEESATLAVATLDGLGVGGEDARRVRDLVLVTADHVPPPDDEAGAALCDADLAILAAPPDRYAEYVAGVRHEYRHLDDATFRAGRAVVLRDLSQRRVLFRTERGRERWDADARRNLVRELAGLPDRP